MWSTNNFYCLCQVWSLQGNIINYKSLPQTRPPTGWHQASTCPSLACESWENSSFSRSIVSMDEFNGCFSGVRWQREGHRFLCRVFPLARTALVRWLKREKWIIWQFKTRETSQRLFFSACRSPSYLALLLPFMCIVCVSSSSYDGISSAFRVHFFGSLLL